MSYLNPRYLSVRLQPEPNEVFGCLSAAGLHVPNSHRLSYYSAMIADALEERPSELTHLSEFIDEYCMGASLDSELLEQWLLMSYKQLKNLMEQTQQAGIDLHYYFPQQLTYSGILYLRLMAS